MNELMEKIRRELPSAAFRPHPQSALLLIPLLGIIMGGTVWIATALPPWYLALPAAFVIGQAYASLAFLGHETLHGSVFASRRCQTALGFIAFLIFCIPPRLWRLWHNELHHGHTNKTAFDPDAPGHLEEFYHRPWFRWSSRYFALGSGHWLSIFSLFYGLDAQMLMVLTMKPKTGLPRHERTLRMARAESLAIALFWLLFAVWLGIPTAIYCVLIPMAIANFTVMSYIITNHRLRPVDGKDDPLEHSMSVLTLPFFDWLHLNFSHHVEHHFFPQLSWRFTPLVRQGLRKHAPERFEVLPHLEALKRIFQKVPRERI